MLTDEQRARADRILVDLICLVDEAYRDEIERLRAENAGLVQQVDRLERALNEVDREEVARW